MFVGVDAATRATFGIQSVLSPSMSLRDRFHISERHQSSVNCTHLQHLKDFSLPQALL